MVGVLEGVREGMLEGVWEGEEVIGGSQRQRRYKLTVHEVGDGPDVSQVDTTVLHRAVFAPFAVVSVNTEHVPVPAFSAFVNAVQTVAFRAHTPASPRLDSSVPVLS